MAAPVKMAEIDDKPVVNLAWRQFWALVHLLARQAKLRESAAPSP